MDTSDVEESKKETQVEGLVLNQLMRNKVRNKMVDNKDPRTLWQIPFVAVSYVSFELC